MNQSVLLNYWLTSYNYQIQAYYQLQVLVRSDVISWQSGMYLPTGQVKNIFTCLVMKRFSLGLADIGKFSLWIYSFFYASIMKWVCYVLLGDVMIWSHHSMGCVPCSFLIGCEYHDITVLKLLEHKILCWSPFDNM